MKIKKLILKVSNLILILSSAIFLEQSVLNNNVPVYAISFEAWQALGADFGKICSKIDLLLVNDRREVLISNAEYRNRFCKDLVEDMREFHSRVTQIDNIKLLKIMLKKVLESKEDFINRYGHMDSIGWRNVPSKIKNELNNIIKILESTISELTFENAGKQKKLHTNFLKQINKI